MAIKCSKCGNENAADAKICVHCKTIISGGKKEQLDENKKTDNEENTEDKEHELKEKYKEQMHGDGGEQFNEFVNENKKKHSSKLIAGLVSLVFVIVLCIAGKIIYDNWIAKDYVIRNVNIGMTKDEVIKSEEEGTKNVVSDDVIIFEDIEYAEVTGDVFYSFRDGEQLYFIAMKFDYNKESVDKLINKLEASYGETSAISKDETKRVWEIDEHTSVYLVVSEMNKIIEVDVCEPDETLNSEIKGE